MNEAFLHFIWQYRLYRPNIKTLDQQLVEVINPGQLNSDAGPDFSNARIRIGKTIWAGNIEIHLKASDWYVHNHHHDASYSNIILHVVLENNKAVNDRNGKPIPVLELKGLIDEGVYKKYFYFINNKKRIPCEKDIHSINPITMSGWLERLFIERMEHKTETLGTLFKHNANSLTQTFYQVLAGNFGFKTNEQPFKMLARVLPINTLGKHKNSLFQIEAMLFGCSGLLDKDYKDDYPNELLQEFKFLQNKYSLTKIETHLWKFLRLRPTNFPTIRISQFAALVYKSENLFSKILETDSSDQLRKFFDVKASSYWDNHYTFDKSVTTRVKTLGESAINNLILNTVVQFLFFYAQIKGKQTLRDRAIDVMLQIKPEKNHIINQWKQIGVEAKNAFESQALIELKNNYCKQKQCLKCNIGTKLLRDNADYR